MALTTGTLEYMYTIGSVAALVGMLVSLVLSRRDIAAALRDVKLTRKHLIMAGAILVMFAAIEGAMVKPTQQIFFDDVIYQGMAVDMIHMGQAWMCDYGTPTFCYSGEILHEPVGAPLNLAVAFLAFGVSQASAYGTEFFLSGVAVLMTFLSAALLLRNARAALFSELFIALSPMLLIWARPTTSDMPMLTYSMVALFAVLVFAARRNVRTFSFALLSTALLLYMKVDALAYLPLLAIFYLLVSDRSLKESLVKNWRRIYGNLLNTKALLVVLLFVLLITPEVNYTLNELNIGHYGVTGSYIQETCKAQPWPSVPATSSISLANLRYNICDNILFWFNADSSQLMPQPLLFTAFAMLGLGLLVLYGKAREAALLGVWFAAFFLLYTAFYAGGVDYGVDWRFMLSVLAPASILAGAGAAYIIEFAGDAMGTKGRGRRKPRRIATALYTACVLALVAYSFILAVPAISVNPSSVQQAGQARFYENFVYSALPSIPHNCFVYTYDPTLFQINGFAAAQMTYLYNTGMYNKTQLTYGCNILDYGYWCGTPNNICSQIESMYNLSLITNATYVPTSNNYALYRMTGIK